VQVLLGARAGDGGERGRSCRAHKGDWTKFITGKLQSLCEACHNSAKRQIELHGLPL
jgi:hypothetical protein